MIDSYRPWGSLHWILGKLPSATSWDVIGTIAAESRAKVVPSEIHRLGILGNLSLLAINDEESRFTQSILAAREKNLEQLEESLQTVSPNRYELDLFSELDQLESFADEILQAAGPNVVLDISALPKRFFFYLVRRLEESQTIQNFVVAYSLAKKHGEVLHINPGSWSALPSYGTTSSTRKNTLLIIAVGYHHLKLVELMEDRKPDQIRLLMPFPSKPPGFALNWEFASKIYDQFKFKHHHVRRVDPFSVSLAFDHLCGLSSNHDGDVILAPFGPKPISLAMSLFALASERAGNPVTVGYTQPTAYSDKYSIGIAEDSDGIPEVYSYCIKIKGTKVFGCE